MKDRKFFGFAFSLIAFIAVYIAMDFWWSSGDMTHNLPPHAVIVREESIESGLFAMDGRKLVVFRGDSKCIDAWKDEVTQYTGLQWQPCPWEDKRCQEPMS